MIRGGLIISFEDGSHGSLNNFHPHLFILQFVGHPLNCLVPHTVKRLPAMRETQVLSLVWEDPLEKEMATHSSILAWKISEMEPGRLQSMGLQRVGHD